MRYLALPALAEILGGRPLARGINRQIAALNPAEFSHLGYANVCHGPPHERRLQFGDRAFCAQPWIRGKYANVCN